jgi:hypothetical protein
MIVFIFEPRNKLSKLLNRHKLVRIISKTQNKAKKNSLKQVNSHISIIPALLQCKNKLEYQRIKLIMIQVTLQPP